VLPGTFLPTDLSSSPGTVLSDVLLEVKNEPDQRELSDLGSCAIVRGLGAAAAHGLHGPGTGSTLVLKFRLAVDDRHPAERSAGIRGRQDTPR
jgi:hypothetical protein